MFNVQKTHYFSNTVHYCSSSMPRLSQTHRYLQSPSFRQAQSALIGQLTQCIVISRTPQAHVGNVTPLSIIASFSFQVSFTISSLFFLEIAFVHSQPCTLLGLCCSVVNKSTFGRPNKVLLLSHRNTQRLPDMAASTLLQLLKPHLLSLREHLGGIAQIVPHRDVDMRGRVLTP